MKFVDGHIHVFSTDIDRAAFAAASGRTGCVGGIILSMPPASFQPGPGRVDAAGRLDHVLEWCAGSDSLYPFFWLDPLSETAEEEVALAVEKGIMGFKVICDRFFPSDERAMSLFRFMAASGKPVLFHSGILWDGKVSSKYNRPIEFECLLEIPGLKFALAHISWPWCDELIALYGKFLNAHAGNPELSAELFIDTTPGTPVCYREEALTKLYTVGYDLEDNVIFGSDTTIHDYNDKWVSGWAERDRAILRKMNLSGTVIDKYFIHNAERLVGRNRTKAAPRASLRGV